MGKLLLKPRDKSKEYPFQLVQRFKKIGTKAAEIKLPLKEKEIKHNLPTALDKNKTYIVLDHKIKVSKTIGELVLVGRKNILFGFHEDMDAKRSRIECVYLILKEKESKK
jgi:predicted metalloenzyme YecM